MEILAGPDALSDFRAKKLLKQLQALGQPVIAVRAKYIHFIDLEKPLSERRDRQLWELLLYGTDSGDSNLAGKGHVEGFVVIPRPGTISPWSSKATDIVRNAGLTEVKRVERGTGYDLLCSQGQLDREVAASLLHDRMTEAVVEQSEDAAVLFEEHKPKPLGIIDISSGKASLQEANSELALAMSEAEIDYLHGAYKQLGRNPTDVELMMFAQVNSEHTRHKIFNADWVINGKKQPKSLFKMIKNTYEKGGQDVLSAYSDNAAVLRGPVAWRFFADGGTYSYHKEPVHSVIKVETHNHPTAIAPVPGAATGIGGEIRDEAATGRGAHSKMGLAGFTVSNLRIPEATQPWEKSYGKPGRIVSPLDIMLHAPIGGAGYANEFGRPNLLGYFRTYEEQLADGVWGYHKPIMIAGGLGNIRDMHVQKRQLPVGAKIIQLGGPAMLIGLGGGASASMGLGSSSEELDFASVQRGNGEIERRANEVIDACWALGEDNPIITIHDVGAGGLCNALPELVHDSGRGGSFELRDIPSAEPGLSPLEIWCNEAQERYVLGIAPEDLAKFEAICARERCPFAVVGEVTEAEQLILNDRMFKNQPIDLPIEVLFGKPPKMTREVDRQPQKREGLELDGIKLDEAIERVLKLPAVGSKKFLITIGDRTVGGLVARDQMVGPWQVPVSDVAVSAAAFNTDAGEAMAMGERSPLALIDAPAAARMAVGEAITNIAAADIAKLQDIKLSANWMAAAGHAQEDQHLYDSVKTIGEDFCPTLGLTIPVGKDSLSMRTTWRDNDDPKSVTSPVSLIITSFAPVQNVEETLTPQLDLSQETSLILIDLSKGNQRLGGSALAQVYNQLGNAAPDADPNVLKSFFNDLTELKKRGKILAYHDRSDGGLLATVLEMSFASRCGLDLDFTNLPGRLLEKLFNEELGAVIQVAKSDEKTVLDKFDGQAYALGQPMKEQSIQLYDKELSYKYSRAELETWWNETSYRIQKLRDNPESAEQEFVAIKDDADPGLSPKVTFEITSKQYETGPKVAIFREQGVNGQVEMAAAFDRAGFTAVDVHLNDLLDSKLDLDDFVGLAACGGFSYGDVLGAGEGWAKSILFHDELRTKFSKFFAREDTFSLGVCNGCQTLAALKELIPGAENWPAFKKNTSEQFEARVVTTRINKTPSILFKGMEGSVLPVPTAHGEGRAEFANEQAEHQAIKGGLILAQYTDNRGKVTQAYPSNPNGSPDGIAALTTPDGRATIIMPHPERAFLTRQLSWHPPEWGNESPWFRIFQNARAWVDKN
ncbi:MAG TPA: phosphoribosylformylglycinamidine synthase [Candidatus Saccharimonadia bacterium]|nr:phosphoribosylformylglycinamidine synthase [Candidatus Saccharimonadia bacterium]